MTFWNKKIECMDRQEIEQIQLENLQATLNRVYKNVRHYRKVFRDIDFMPEDLKTVSDIKRLPLITRRDLSLNYPYDMFAVSLREVVRLHMASVNFDDPIVVGFTRNDIQNWGELIARNLTAVGVTKDDVVQIALTFGIVTGPFGVQVGAEQIGASVIPMSSRKFQDQVKIMRDFRTTVLVSTPTVALGLAQMVEELDVDPNKLALKHAILGSEPWSESTRAEIESGMQVTATDTYGLTELFGPGVAWECPVKNGLHIAEDHFIPEIIHPVTLESLPPGTEGELVLTSISKEAFPLIRFRTGDITKIDYSPCACGRTHCRISRIFQKCDDVVVVKGTSIAPEQISRIIARIIGGQPVFQLVIEQINKLDQLVVLLEISDITFFDEMKKQNILVESLHREISEFLGWEVTVRLVEPGTFDSNRKVLDKRIWK
ncbi:MAG: phenylacetate--CoA ligase family protein [Thermodesulfobacteriota bacterium]